RVPGFSASAQDAARFGTLMDDAMWTLARDIRDGASWKQVMERAGHHVEDVGTRFGRTDADASTRLGVLRPRSQESFVLTPFNGKYAHWAGRAHDAFGTAMSRPKLPVAGGETASGTT